MFSNQGGYNVSLGFGLTNAVWGGVRERARRAQHLELDD